MPRSQTLTRTVGIAALTTLAVGTAAPAYAGDAYRYWGFYSLSGHTWQYAQKGVGETVPADGTVNGFRYAVGDMSTARNPRAVATFQEICGQTPAAAGKKRVGVVVDFGRPADARDKGATIPQSYSKCATVDTKATSADVLAAVAKTRVENKMLCAIDGYPATGCSDVVKTLTAEQKAPDDTITLQDMSTSQPTGTHSAASAPSSSSGGTNPALWAGLAAAVLAVAAIASAVVSRRKRA